VLVSDHLVYLELQKTGSTYIREVLRRSTGGQLRGKHNRADDSLLSSGRLIAGSIRNPWHWYVSLWAFGVAGRGSVWGATTKPRSFSSNQRWGRAPCGPWQPGMGLRKMLYVAPSVAAELRRRPSLWRAAYADGTDARQFRDWVTMLLVSRRGDVQEGFALSRVSSFAGLMTYRYASLHWRDPSWLYGHRAPRTADELRATDAALNVLDTTIRLECVDTDLAALLNQLGSTPRYSPTAPHVVNSSRHANPSHYYDERTVELVRSRERLIIDKYGYEPPLASS
jgi:hypothetical protein